MNGSTTTLIVEASGSSTGVVLGGVSLGLVLSSLLGLALYVLRKRGVVTAEQVAQAQKIATDVLKSEPVVAAAKGNETLAQIVDTAKVVVVATDTKETSPQ
jgi:ABC-type methionine transport system permease subunit